MAIPGIPGGKGPNQATEFVLPRQPFADGTDSTTVLRNPLIANTPQKAQIGAVDLIPNLLLTTLAVVIVSLPPGQQQTANAPSLRQVYADTSQGTPQTLIPIPVFPAGKQAFVSTPSTQQIYADTSRGTPGALTPPPPFPPGQRSIDSAPSYRQIYDDTSAGTPKTLTTDSVIASANMPENLQLVERKWNVTDTSRGSPMALLVPPVAAPFVPKLGLPVPQVREILDDTSQGTLLPLLAPPAPFTSRQLEPPFRLLWQPLDTSRGTPETLRPEALVTPARSTDSGPAAARKGEVYDTSVGANLSLLVPPPAPPPVVSRPPTFQLPQRKLDILADTSQGSDFALLIASPAAPFIPAASLPVPYVKWQALDTSTGIPKPLFGDSIQPVQVTFLPAPERKQISLLDTSQSSPLLLLVPPAPVPFVPHLLEPSQRVVWQPLDTSRGMPKTLFADAIPPFVTYHYTPPDAKRPVVDTSQSSPLALLATVPPPFVPAPHLAPVQMRWQPLDTSRGTPKTLFADAVMPFNTVSSFPPAPMRAIWQPVDTSRSTFAPLLTPVVVRFIMIINE